MGYALHTYGHLLEAQMPLHGVLIWPTSRPHRDPELSSCPSGLVGPMQILGLVWVSWRVNASLRRS
jgi:hypothetical protein